MPRRRTDSLLPFPIGNCKVEVQGGGCTCTSPNAGCVVLSFPSGNSVKISVTDDSGMREARKPQGNLSTHTMLNDNGEEKCHKAWHSFQLLNPKNIDSCNKSLLQKILKIYKNELPSMNFAANTGKKSSFLQSCVSNGKYKTLILKLNSVEGNCQVVAAVSYQIISADMQFAEIPLTAVISHYQKQGFGRLIYKELRKRLEAVGVCTIFCWADKKSEMFWLKQGFISIGDVDNRGKACRLPIKADIRRALCFPGDSTLMVVHLDKNSRLLGSSLPMAIMPVGTSDHEETLSSHGVSKCNKSDKAGREDLLQMERDIPHLPHSGNSFDHQKIDGMRLDYKAVVARRQDNHEARVSPHSSSDLNSKRNCWEFSTSSLRSKRVKGSHHISCNVGPLCDFLCKNDLKDDTTDYDMSNSCKILVKETPRVSSFCSTVNTRIIRSDHNHTEHHSANALVTGENPKVMFMNIDDHAKKANLTKIIEDLGGSVTSVGRNSTHVITGKARRTFNFCVALCSGAWIVSSNWLKQSFRDGRFLDEFEFILEDEDYVSKYKIQLKEAVLKAIKNPRGLLKGFQFCVAKHVEPSGGVLSAIIEAAGGHVIRKLSSMKQPSNTIFLACEEDMDEALAAAKMGVWTYGSEWFMNCIMKQELDFEAPQFAESL